LNGRDLYELQRVVKDKGVDILFGNTKCTPIAKDEDVAFVRCGFPVYDRLDTTDMVLWGITAGCISRIRLRMRFWNGGEGVIIL